jgi:hypothetical protein
LTATRLSGNSPPEVPKNLEQFNPNLNDYLSDRMESNSRLWISNITNWCHQQEERHSKYPNPSNVVYDIFSMMPYDVRVEAGFSFGQDVIG